MRQVLSLDGTWSMSFCPVGTGSLSALPGLPVYPYAVPGDVHTPLIEAGLIQEPLIGLNDLDCRWVEEQEFWCVRAFTLRPEEIRRHNRLTLEGLDCTADIWLNGQLLGRRENAFVEASYEVTPLLRPGENTLTIRIDDGSHDATRKPLELMSLMWNNEQPYRVWMRKPQFVYGWDWTVWLSSCGIWRSVSLTGWDDALIEDLYAETISPSLAEGRPGEIAVTVSAENPALRRVTVLDAEGNTVAVCETEAETIPLTIPEAHLWWCNGMGAPYLYTIHAALLDSEGGVLDEQFLPFGLRTIALEEPPLPGGDTGFTFTLNGQPVFCKGANHVPADCLPGRVTPEKEERLVALARDAGMNMLRVWGGGVYASEAFLNACDRAGIMVWHDFLYACGFYPDHDPNFVRNITEEAELAVLRLRRHTSLIGWAGNNEIQEMYQSIHQWHPELPFYGQRIYESILPDITARLCPRLIYRPSSPHGGHYQGDTHHGDLHYWKFTHVFDDPQYMDLWRFTDLDAKFLSEFGILGAMPLETAQRCIPADHMRHDDPVWRHHSNSNRDWEVMDRMLLRYFEEIPDDPGQVILRSQALQAEITRHIYDEFRCRKFRCSGLLFWTLSDSMGIHNWSLIDHSLRRKPVYHALRRSMRPVSVAIRGWDVQTTDGEAEYAAHWQYQPDPLEVWGMNDTLTDCPCHAEYRLMTLAGTVLQSEACEAVIPANASVRLLSVPLAGISFDPADTILTARLYQGDTLLAENRYFFAPFRRMLNRNPQIRCEAEPLGGNRWRVTLRADRFVWLAHLAEPDGTHCDENDFDLYPGEARIVTVYSDDPAYAPRVDCVR